MNFKMSSVTADILNYISDGKIHTLQEIANEVEVSKWTVFRHIKSLSYRLPIETFCGGAKKGGVKLDSKYFIHGKILTNEKLQILGNALTLLESVDEYVDKKLLHELIKDFSPPTKNKEVDKTFYDSKQTQFF